MASKTDKITAILHGLLSHSIDNDVIIRLELRRLIGGKLEIIDRHTVTGWINFLLGEHFIRLNPTSETISVESNPYVKGGLYPATRMRMPNNETRYYINVDKCKCFLKEHTPHTPQTKQTTLTHVLGNDWDFNNR